MISIPGYIVWNVIVILKTPFAVVIIRLGSFVTKRYANRINRCKTCDAYVSVAITAKRGKHSCTKKFCATCNELVSFDHRCYIKVVEKVSKKANAETLQSNVSSFEGIFFYGMT